MYIDLGTLSAILLLVLLFGSAWFWSDSLRARDRVIKICSRLCNDIGVQFLDETVALSRLRLRRNTNGGLQLIRHYTFEYSGTGADRWQGYALLYGMRMDSVQLQGPDGLTILDTNHPAVTIPASQLSGPISTAQRIKPH